MKERTSLADQYLLEHFYETCSAESKQRLQCSGVEISQGYSWLDVAIYGDRKCRNCEYIYERQGFYYGKGVYSAAFEEQKYVTLNNIRTQEEFESVCSRINPDVQGIVIRGAITNALPFERFEKLEFIALNGQRIEQFWDLSKNPNLHMLTIYGNKHLKSVKGIEGAKKLACIQFLTNISSVDTVKIDSLEPLSKLPELKEVILSATEPLDHNIDYLIRLEKLEYLWISPNLFPTQSYAKFEAQKFMLSDAYGIYLEDGEDIFPYGKGKRVIHTAQQREKYLKEYLKLLGSYK